jgi:hypothetical protein
MTMTQQMMMTKEAPEESRLALLASKKCCAEEKSKELPLQAQECNVEKAYLSNAKGNNNDGLDGPSDASSRAPAKRRSSSSSHSSSEDLLFDSLHSVHSTTSTLNWQDDDDDDDDSELSDFESSFSSMGCDDDDDEEAYREQRNMLAKQTIENAKPRRELLTKAQSMRRLNREPSFLGTLDLIAE